MIKRYKFWRRMGYSIKESVKVALFGNDFIQFGQGVLKMMMEFVFDGVIDFFTLLGIVGIVWLVKEVRA